MAISNSNRHWIFGYGSLICADSRARTGLTGEAIPVIVQGLERHWSVALSRADLSAVGVSSGNPKAETGGVLFSLSEQGFTEFDRREAEYERQQLNPEQVNLLADGSLPDGQFWVYKPKPSRSPHPIPQSYLDVILNGCLNISTDFAAHFIRHTGQWKPRLDDRQQPLYPRPLRPEQHGVWPQIDHLLATQLDDSH